ncbi:MAG: hypothetical protein ISR76_07520 [Planctomycetes bacterium]|nr:hypothetical protein [Planctomycetota bacterium]
MSQLRSKPLSSAAALLFALAAGPAAAQQIEVTRLDQLRYEVVDLGALGTDTNQTWSINAAGQIAGYSRLADGHGNYHLEGFFWDGASLDYIGTPGGAPMSDLLGTNDLGQAVGKTGGDKGQALLRRVNGSVQRLGTLGGSRSYARAINDLGQVVGSSDLAGDFESRPFLWENGAMIALPLLGGTQGAASWINDSGQIVGGSTTDTGGLQQFAVIWEGGTVTQLPPIYPGLGNIANSIHDDGTIAGTIRLPEGLSFRSRAAIWKGGLVFDLGTLADGTPVEPFASSWASGVNSAGMVVGMSVNPQSQLVPFLHWRGDMVQLDHLMEDPWIGVFLGAGAINDAGQIAVSGMLPGGSSRALLLNPVWDTKTRKPW